MTAQVAEARAFFGPRAAGWDERFPDDRAVFDAAIAELHLAPDAVVLDAGCGTGRVIPLLRDGTGPAAVVVGIDPVPEMLAAAQARRRAGSLVQGDVLSLPLGDASLDAVLASGLLPHLPDVTAALGELGRVVRPGGALAVFHPIGRAALAARHGRSLGTDDPLDPANLVRSLITTGWVPELVDDGERYLVVARRLVPLSPLAEERLATDELLWLTTVDARGRPQSSPVWFVWHGGALVLVTEPDAGKVANLAGNPAVAAHLDGRHVVSLEGWARVGGALTGELRELYLAKYSAGIARFGTDADTYLSDFSTVIRIVPTRARVYDSV